MTRGPNKELREAADKIAVRIAKERGDTGVSTMCEAAVEAATWGRDRERERMQLVRERRRNLALLVGALASHYPEPKQNVISHALLFEEALNRELTTREEYQ